MKIVLNTQYKEHGAQLLINEVVPELKKAGHEVAFDDNDYKAYDMAIFTAPDSEVRVAKEKNPKLITWISDPKLSLQKQIEESKAADFLQVTSLEQKDVFLKHNKNIIVYNHFPKIDEVKKEHKQKEKIIIGYHGNKVHLESFFPVITEALNYLGQKYDVELWAMYNIERLGKWTNGVPKDIEVKHIQWSWENYYEYMSKCDIGLCNNQSPVHRGRGLFFSKLLRGSFGRIVGRYIGYHLNYSPKDFLVRFKYTANPSRMYIFARFHIPVISDFAPSAGQFIQDSVSGYLADSKEAWIHAFETLIKDHQLRQSMGDKLFENMNRDAQLSDLVNYISTFGNKI